MNKLTNASFVTRTISGVVLFVVVVGAVLLSRYSFMGLLMVICGGAMGEFYRIARVKGAEPMSVFGIVVGLLIVVANVLALEYAVPSMVADTLLAVAFLLVFVTFFAELYRKRENPLVNIAVTLMGIIYVAVPLTLLFLLSMSETSTGGPGALLPTFGYSPWVVLCYIFLVWANDVGAYLFGVMFGRRKLFERISPKKSWEGFFGGILVAVTLGALEGWLLDGTWGNMFLWAGLAAIVVVTGVLGDLVESMFKRSAGIKDSGSIMPGHGGFLDRFDALLLSTPFVYIYFTTFAG